MALQAMVLPESLGLAEAHWSVPYGGAAKAAILPIIFHLSCLCLQLYPKQTKTKQTTLSGSGLIFNCY